MPTLWPTESWHRSELWLSLFKTSKLSRCTKKDESNPAFVSAICTFVKKHEKSNLEWEGWWITEQGADSLTLSLALVPFPGGCIVYRQWSTAVVWFFSICWTPLLLLSRNQGSTCSYHGLIGKFLETYESGLRKEGGEGGDMNVLLCLQRYEQVVFLLLVWKFWTWLYIRKYNQVFSKFFHNCWWRNH